MSRTGIVLLLGIAVLLAACTDPLAERFQRQLLSSYQRFGEDGRLSLLVESGRVVAPTEQAAPFQLGVRAAAPFPEFSLDNGTREQTQVRLMLRNVAPDIRFYASVEQLPDAVRQDPRCRVAEDRAELPVLFDPLLPRADTDGVQVLDVQVPACARVIARGVPDPSRAVWSVAVLGDVAGRLGDLETVLRTLAEEGIDHVAIVGALSDGKREADLADIDALVTRYGLVLTTTLAPGDVDFWRTHQDTFGPSDLRASIGGARLFAVDASAGRLLPEQLARLRATPVSDRPAAALLSVAPIDLQDPQREGMRSAEQARRLVAAFDARGTQSIATAHPRLADRPLARMQLVGAPPLQGAASDWWQLDVVRPIPVLPLCDRDTDCVEGSCLEGLCRRTCRTDVACGGETPSCDPRTNLCAAACTTDADCPGPAPACGGSGWCVLRSELLLSRQQR